MKFTRERPDGIYSVHAIEQTVITINSPLASDGRDEDGHLSLRHSFIISPRWLHQPWRPRRLEDLQPGDLEARDFSGLEVLLLGTGRQMQFPRAEQLQTLISLGIGYEVMDSAAACRTYNILAGEGRQVAAAVLLDQTESQADQ